MDSSAHRCSIQSYKGLADLKRSVEWWMAVGLHRKVMAYNLP